MTHLKFCHIKRFTNKLRHRSTLEGCKKKSKYDGTTKVIHLRNKSKKETIKLDRINKRELYLGPIELYSTGLHNKAIISALL
jgi:hypothetical protein